MTESTGPWWDYPRGPAGVRRFVEVGVAYELSVEQCLAGTTLVDTDLDAIETIVEAHEELQVARNLLGALGDRPGFGAEVGAGFTLGSAGILGFAVMSSPTVRDALEVGIRYLALGSFFLKPSIIESAEEVRLTFDDADIPADARRFLTERDLSALAQVLPVFLGSAASELHLDGDSTTFTMPVAVLDRPLPAADRHTAALFEKQCAELLDRRKVRRGTSAAVRARLLRQPARMPSMDEVAAELHLDTRTLHRRLAAESTSFRVLAAEVREGLAIELLGQAGLTVGEVGRRLGYSEVAAFSRAFKRWTGRPPQEYRHRT